MQKIKDFIYYNRKDVVIVLVFLSLFVGYTFINKNDKSEVVEDNLIEQEQEENITLVVDIKGEVNNPGTYKLNKDERVIDVVNLAGGFTNNADASNINLSEKVHDEMLIIIPCIERQEEVTEEKKVKETVEVKDNKISINNGSLEELMTIKGIGLTKAKSIIEYRNKVGKFKSIDEIMYVSGIGKATFEKIKDYIKV